jgi:gliding motility-associated-like protein
VNSITLTPTTSDANATVKVNGISVVSGAASTAIALNAGSNTITTIVTSQDKSTSKTYTITVSRALSANANIVLIKLSSGTLSPKFAQATTSYTASVTNATASITLTPTTNEPNASIEVDGVAVASGTASQAIALSVGSNTITAVCTAQDGVTKKTYTITVTRAMASANSIYQPASVVNTTDKPRLTGDEVVVHQGLSPNGDGINDFLVIDGISNYPDNKLTVMNRNGEPVFEARAYNNTSNVFDGHSNKNGRMQLPGTYFYALDYKDGAVIKHKTGFIVLKY